MKFILSDFFETLFNGLILPDTIGEVEKNIIISVIEGFVITTLGGVFLLKTGNITSFLLLALLGICDVGISVIFQPIILFLLNLIISSVINLGMAVSTIFCDIYAIIKNNKLIREENKIIKHKIEWLNDYKLPNQRIDMSKQIQKSSVWVEYIEKYISNIYVMILSLNDEDKKILKKELEEQLIDYRTKLSNIPQSGLTLESEASISTNFIIYLTELEQKINQKLSSQINIKSLDTETEAVQVEMPTDSISSGKVRKKILQI